MDFVLRDAYMSGYSTRAFDLDRLLHYTMFTAKGLTIHERGLSALVRFISVRAELFRAIYFHRTVRAIDLSLQDLFVDSKRHLFPGNPLEHLDEYQRLDRMVAAGAGGRLATQPDRRLRALGAALAGVPAPRACVGRWPSSGRSSLPPARRNRAACSATCGPSRWRPRAAAARRWQTCRSASIRPGTSIAPASQAPAAGQNFLFDPTTGKIRGLDDRELFRRIAISYRICRIYAEDHQHNAELAAAMDQITGGGRR